MSEPNQANQYPSLDGRTAFLAWADAQGASDDDWRALHLALVECLQDIFPVSRRKTTGTPQSGADVHHRTLLIADASALIEGIRATDDGPERFG